MDKNKVFVMGSYVTDLTARATHLPKPGETVLGKNFRTGAGRKGSNQAAAIARLGAEVTLVTKLGNDAFGKVARQHFITEGIDISYIAVDHVLPTGTALIAVDDQSENMIVVTISASGNIQKDEVEQAEEELKKSALVLTQLETNLEAVEVTLALAKKHKVPIALNPAPYQNIPADWFKEITYITPNETEAAQLTGMPVETIEEAKLAAEKIHKMGVENVIITLGKLGSLLYNEKNPGVMFDRFPVKAIDTTGAGDAFNGGFAYALANDFSLEEAVRFGNATGALSVTKEGTAQSMPTLKEVETFLKKRE